MEPSKNLCPCSLSHFLKKENNAIIVPDKLKHPSTSQNRSSSSSNPKLATNNGWKPSKRGSSNPKSASSKKGPAQRGLGVAQLERLRLSQMNQPLPPSISSSPSSYCSDPVDSFMCSCCYNNMAQQQHYRAVGTFGPGPVSPITRRPLHYERSSTLMINRPVMEGIFGARAAWSELPSNQTPLFISSPMQKKGGAEEGLGFTNGGSAGSCSIIDYFAVKQQERNNGYSEREIKEYQFFPNSSCAPKGDDSELGYPTSTAAASNSFTDCPNFVDLSLKLF